MPSKTPTSASSNNYSYFRLNSAWPRGYERKGTTLTSMGRYDEAIETYKQGLAHDANNAALINGLKAAEDKKKSAGAGPNPMMNQAYLQGMMKLLSNPETKDLISDPGFMQKVQTIMQNPAAYEYFANDPKIKKAFEVISSDAPSDFNFEDLMKNAPKEDDSRMDEEFPEPKYEPKKEEPKPQPKKEEPKPEPKVEDPAEILKNQGNAEFKKKNFAAAIDLYEQAIQQKSEEPLYYNNKAAAYIELGEYEKAHAELDRADQLFTNGNKDYSKKAKVLARRASLFNKEGKYDESISCYEKSLIEDNVQKVRDELKVVRKLQKEKAEKEYINPELAEKACENANALFKEGKSSII